MRRLDRRRTALAGEHPWRAVALAGLAAGLVTALLALLIGRLLFREWARGRPLINAAVVAAFAVGFSTYTRAGGGDSSGDRAS